MRGKAEGKSLHGESGEGPTTVLNGAVSGYCHNVLKSQFYAVVRNGYETTYDLTDFFETYKKVLSIYVRHVEEEFVIMFFLYKQKKSNNVISLKGEARCQSLILNVGFEACYSFMLAETPIKLSLKMI